MNEEYYRILKHIRLKINIATKAAVCSKYVYGRLTI